MSYFELTSQPIDPRILIKPGMANGYGIVDVESLEVTREKLAALGAKEFSEVPCEGTRCMVTEDPSGNVIVWRKLAKPAPNNSGSPVIVIDPDTSNSAWATRVLDLMTAWVSADIEETLSMTGPDVNWVDDGVGEANGLEELKPLLAERWDAMGAGAVGIHGQLTISSIKGQSFGDQDLVTFEADLSIPERPRDNNQFLVIFYLQTQLAMEQNTQLELAMNHQIFLDLSTYLLDLYSIYIDDVLDLYYQSLV